MVHPYLLFSRSEAGELRKRLKEGPRSKVHLQHAVRCCEQFLDPDSNHFFDFRERKADFWYSRQGNFVIPARLLTLALTGWLADRPEFLDVAREGILTLIREKVCDRLGDYTEWRSGYWHDSGKFFLMLSLLYDLLYHLLSEEDRRTLIENAEENFEFAIQSAREASRFIDNNRGSKYLVGLSIMAITFKDLVRRHAEVARTWALRSNNWLPMGLRHGVGRYGALMEGPLYGMSHVVHLSLAAHILARCGYRNMLNDVRFGRAGDYLLYEMVYSEGWVNNLNDCHKVQLYPLPYIAGILGERPACLWLWDRFGGDPSRPDSLVHPEHVPQDFSSIPWTLLWPDRQDSRAAPPSECGYPNARHFVDRGIVTMRSGWGPEDLHVTMISGEPVRTAHRQADQNQVTFYALGELFLIDTGYYETDPETGEALSGKIAEAHSLVLIDDECQSSYETEDGWPMGHIESFVAGENHAYAMGDASEAYNPNLTIRRAERHIHAVWKADVSPYVLWVDDIEADGDPHRYTLMLHTAAGNRFEWNGSRITLHGRQHLLDIHLITTAPESIHLESYGRHPRLHIEQTCDRARFVMLLHPRRTGDEPAEFSAQLSQDAITAKVRLSEKTAEHVFDTSERQQTFSGEGVVYIQGPAWA